MPAIVTLPSAPNTGAGMLGQVILSGATEYARNKREDDIEARRRSQRLADVADERQYAEQVSNMAMRRELVRLGYLAPGDLKNEQAVAAAFARAQRDGTAQRYKEAIDAGDLAYADLGDAAKVEAGLAKFSQRMATRTTFQSGLPQRAQDRVNQLVVQQDELQREGARLASILSEPEPVPTPQEVAARALQLARATAKPGTMPSVQDIAQMETQAIQEIGTQKLTAWNQQRQDALVQRTLISDRLRDVSAEINTLTNRFGVTGVVDPNAARQPAPPPSTAASKPDLGTAQKNFAAAIQAELDRRNPKPTPRSNLAEPRMGGLAGVAESLPSPRSGLAMVPTIIPEMARQAEGTVKGILSGDFSVPERGLVEHAGEAIGSLFAVDPMVFNAEERILREQPYSPKALEIKRRRAQQQGRLHESAPINTPTATMPAEASRYRLLDPVY